MKKEVDAEFAPKKKGKKKPSGDRRSKSDDAEEWITNSKEDAEADYKDEECYATPEDKEAKKTFLDDMKLYKAGQTDPRNKEVKLEKDLVKKIWRSCVRRGATFHDEDDAVRCQGSKIFKAGRVGSIHTKANEIRGKCVYQCAGKKEIGDFCKGCSAKKSNFFEFKYPRSKQGKDITAGNFLTESVKCC